MTIGPEDRLAVVFNGNRERLHKLARRILGSDIDAQDAVQEAWLRLVQSSHQELNNVGAWLTTVVARVCLDMLRRRSVRGETSFDENAEELDAIEDDRAAPSDAIELADSVSLALAIVLESLSPLERVAFVLHDLFEVPFDDVAQIVSRSPEAARKLASRARQRIRGADADTIFDRERSRQMIDAFLAAARTGDFAALLRLLHPDVVVEADDTIAIRPPAIRGAEKAARYFAGRAQAARAAIAGTEVGALVTRGDGSSLFLRFETKAGKLFRITATTDPAFLRRAVSM